MLKINKTCDACRQRKIRCIVVAKTEPGAPPVCVYCEKRDEPCHFSVFRRRAIKITRQVTDESAVSALPKLATGELLIDRILQHGSQDAQDATPNGFALIKAKGDFATCAPLALFSENGVRMLCEKIGSSRPALLLDQLEETLMARINYIDDSPWETIDFAKSKLAGPLTKDEARLYIDVYFRDFHPIYPFLDREEFEAKVNGPDFHVLLKDSPAFSALYHAVCALGSQEFHGVPYQPGASHAWNIFAVALGRFQDLMLPGQTLEYLQALLAICIFAQGPSCMQLSDTFVFHTARCALSIRAYVGSADVNAARAFWVIYRLEKQTCLEDHIGSMIPDEDVSCIVPRMPVAIFGNFDWFLSSIKCARISSHAYRILFSVSATLGDTQERLEAVKSVRRMIEEWRLWVPADFRPGEPVRILDTFSEYGPKMALLQTQFWYYSLITTLERLTLYLDKDEGLRSQQSRLTLMQSARTMAEMTRYIELKSHTPLFVLCIAPLSALFILFDFVIHNPHHHETRSNLMALDTLAGYFSLVEHASQGGFKPAGKIISEFAEIAREYYAKVQQSPTENRALAQLKRQHEQDSKLAPRSNDEAGRGLLSQGPPSSGAGASTWPGQQRVVDGVGLGQGASLPDTPSDMQSINSMDYLVYPVPGNLGEEVDTQMFDHVGVHKSLFGGSAQDWEFENDFDFGSMSMGEQQYQSLP